MGRIRRCFWYYPRRTVRDSQASCCVTAARIPCRRVSPCPAKTAPANSPSATSASHATTNTPRVLSKSYPVQIGLAQSVKKDATARSKVEDEVRCFSREEREWHARLTKLKRGSKFAVEIKRLGNEEESKVVDKESVKAREDLHISCKDTVKYAHNFKAQSLTNTTPQQLPQIQLFINQPIVSQCIDSNNLQITANNSKLHYVVPPMQLSYLETVPFYGTPIGAYDVSYLYSLLNYRMKMQY
eukprot:TRINITY_DN11926_c0_g1_i6.p1 TRINITY_DN11926_c0_g1~~TRINITY_DN11926_c0_g1_i6.p1  ORF type:complete len:242 (-),score=12.43 TRINITY_DN11926_c0_g1_i6:141-866(-)